MEGIAEVGMMNAEVLYRMLRPAATAELLPKSWLLRMFKLRHSAFIIQPLPIL
jgi:hypothetical protein